jgi:hypothetical protein
LQVRLQLVACDLSVHRVRASRAGTHSAAAHQRDQVHCLVRQGEARRARVASYGRISACQRNVQPHKHLRKIPYTNSC